MRATIKGMAILFILSIDITSTYAQTCPPVKQLFAKKGEGYEVVVPAGWKLVNTSHKPSPIAMVFKVASWGDRTHRGDSVQCQYIRFMKDDFIRIETLASINEASITSHPEWSKFDPYYLCVNSSNNVNACPFG